MTVPVQDPINQVVIVGGEPTVGWTWYLGAQNEIVVTVQRAISGDIDLLVLDTDYTVEANDLGNQSGGDITPIGSESPVTAGDVWTLSRDTTLNRSPDFPFKGNFDSATVNNQLDKLTRIGQDINRDSLEAIRKDPGVGDTLNPLIPQMVDERALKFRDIGGGNFEMVMSEFDPDTTTQDAADSAAAALASEQAAAISETNAATSETNAAISAAEAAASAAQVPLSNVTAVTDPLVSDDNTLGYGINSHWVNTVTNELYIAFDVSTGAAVWILDKLELASNAEAIGGVENTKAMTSLRVKESIDTFAEAATEQKNIMLNAFRIAINGSLPLLNMVDGFVDEYEDENGVDTGASSNQFFDAVNKLYQNVGTGTTDLVPVMTSDTTPSGVCSASTVFGAGSEAFRAFDEASDEWLTQNGVSTGWVQYQFTSGQVAFAVRLQCGNNVTQMIRDFTVEGSNTGAFSGEETILATVTNETGWSINEKRTFDFASPGSFQFYRVDITAVNGGLVVRVQEVEFLDSAVVDMTLISNSQVAENVPTKAQIILFEEDVDSQILNTDLQAFASRDGGTTFTQITLADDGDYQAGRRILSGSADISGQPSGTNMEYKVETFNTMELKLHGVSLEWS
ncbi:MAG: hypothetical protein V3V76_08475 [Candidatus Adiutricales bacterium]